MLTSKDCKGTFSRAVYAFWELIDLSPFESQPDHFNDVKSNLLTELNTLNTSSAREIFINSIHHCITVKTKYPKNVHNGRGPSLYDFFKAAIQCLSPGSNLIDLQEIQVPINEIETALRPQ